MRKFLILIAAFAFSCPAFAADYTDSVQHREFEVHIPDTVAGQENLPVVIAMHGGGGNAAQFRKQTGFDAIADRNGFMVVYPEGTGALIGNMRTWNAGRCCGTAVKKNVDDVGFISAMIDKLAQKYGIDRTRVYATGHSNGAMMSYRLACELADKIAAIAPNSGQRVFDDCHPTHPVAVLHIHGTADPCALYNGGAQCGGCFSKALGIQLPNDTWACEPVKLNVKSYATLNGCSAETETVFTKGAVTCERYKGCLSAVELCSIAGEGHSWPGGANGRLKTTGPGNNDINAGEFMWEFFKGITR